MKIVRFRQLASAIISSVIVSLASGLVENSPSASTIGEKSSGYPLAWRTAITGITTTVNYRYGNLIVDLVVWFSIFFLMLELIDRLAVSK